MRFTGVIPARRYSSRLPGKCLIEIAGKPMIQWVYERSSQARSLADVVVATDDTRLLEVVRSFGGQAILTSSEHLSGTDRVAEVAEQVESDVFVNIQGDEPLISPNTIDAVCRPLAEDSELLLSTACVQLHEASEIASPHNVKVVRDRTGKALYFSRHPIPYLWAGSGRHFKHLGIYGYRRELLLRLPEMAASELEKAERLEQLRFLESGIAIRVVTVDDDSVGVDTEADLERVRPLLENLARVEVQSLTGR